MRIQDIIKKKRDGYPLTGEEIDLIIKEYTSGNIPDYQVSALLMAIFFRGMTEEETIDLTKSMMYSGKVLNLSDIEGIKIDKHSTGGVGDKTSIILAPLMAAAGLKIPMISGRALGHTGGTLDKLESIPNFKTDLTLEEFKENIRKIGVSMIGQTPEIAPADKKLYALRDVTATVESIPLIASSIMSKKLAEGIQGLVLDVKVGSGAFMKDRDDAKRLARTMIDIGNAMGVKTVAILTDMDQPLGNTIGNSLEIKECISALRGRWQEDLKEVTLSLGARMIEIAKTISDFDFEGEDINDYKKELLRLIDSGAAFKRFVELIDHQYGDPEVAFKPGLLPSAKVMKQIRAEREGYIARMNAEKVGIASMLLGAGRRKIDDVIDYSAGIILNKKVGDFVTPGDQIAMFYCSDESLIKDAEEVFRSGIEIGTEKIQRKEIVLEFIE
ncbi:MAG: thymidine phosphorylase [Thermodesulfovibrionales bacterium]